MFKISQTSENAIVVPEFIVVHLGRPDSNAQNVTVSFPDYVKNVASSEIYPTWPEAALVANIYSIISFALNRIYLQFYRAQGYNFDITNSPSIDQTYVQGRNVFENISNLVDEIFNNYVRRIGNVEPLSTRFCNGTTVTCEGLSQWGTVDLAEQGYTAFEILQYYFGDDIEIVFNAPVGELRPLDENATPLRLGDSGVFVYNAQILLNRISDNYPAIPKIYPVDGVFDEEMETAVKKFQEIFQLTPDGIIGKQTGYKLVYLYVGITELTELDSEGIVLSDFPKYSPVNTTVQAEPQRVLSYKEGDTGEAVRIIQYWLSYISAFYKTIPAVSIDGVFGQNTENSVIQFQKQFNLPQTGMVDFTTWDDLYRVYIGILGDEQSFLDADTVEQFMPMKLGNTGENVRVLQQKLNELKNFYPEIPTIAETGTFGQRTRMGVQAVQRRMGIPVTGEVDYATWLALLEAERNHESSRNPQPLQYPGYILQEGMSDIDLQRDGITTTNPIYHLHDGLRQVAYANESVPLVVPQQQYISDTTTAVRATQRLAGLPETGRVDFDTMEYIREWNN